MTSSSFVKVYSCLYRNEINIIAAVFALTVMFTLMPVLTFASGANASWGYAAIVTPGLGGLQIARNGLQPEIYLTGGWSNYWIALRYNINTQDYDQVYVSTYYSSLIKALRVADVFKDGTPEIIIATEDGQIQLFDQASKALQSTIAAASGVNDLAIADTDGDDVNEIVICTYNHLYIYSISGTLKWDLSGAGGDSLVVAQMDSDNALEIATSDGHVVDSATHISQWDWPWGFGLKMAASDIDGDGMAELIESELHKYTYAYDVDTKLPKWSIETDGDIDAIIVADVDADGNPELLVGEGQYGRLSAFDLITLQRKSFIHNPEFGVTNIAVGDVDHDGKSEVLWGAGADSSGANHLYVANWQTGEIKWQNPDVSGPFVGPEIGDLDGDGRDELVVASFMSDGYKSGRILVFDSVDHRLRGISNPTLAGVVDLKLRDVDGDGNKEILLAFNNGLIGIYSFDTNDNFVLEWTNNSQPGPIAFDSVDAADVDGNGQIEIVGGSGGYVYLYSLASNSGTLEWQSTQMHGSTVAGVIAADADQDGAQEIIALVKDGDVYIFSGASKILKAMIMGPFTSMRVQNINGIPSIVLGKSTGELAMYQYGSGKYSRVYNKKLVYSSVSGFTIDDYNRVWVSTLDPYSLAPGILHQALLNGTETATYSGYGRVFGLRVVVPASSPYMYTAGSYSVNAFQPAGPQADALNLGNGRFSITVEWRTPAGAIGVGHPVPLTSDSGYFWFFDAANVELLVKILDGRAVNGHFWVFYGALSDVQYLITITDTQTGIMKTYYGQQGSQTSANDIEAFSGTLGGSGAEMVLDPLKETASFQAQIQSLGQHTADLVPPAPGFTDLYLNGNRFEVKVSWSTLSGATGTGTAVPLTSDSGYFWFFGATNIELLVKILDGRGVNGHFWVFFGSLTDVQYTITITDTATAAVRTYYGQQGAQRSGNDVNAF